MEFRRLLDPLHLIHLRKDHLQQTACVQKLQPAAGVGPGEQLHQLVPNPLRTHLGDQAGGRLHRFERSRIQPETQRGRKPDRPQHPEPVLGETPVRVPDRPNHPQLQILPPADVINDLPLKGIVKQPVDREIPAECVLFGARENHPFRVAAVFVFLIGPEGGHLVGGFSDHHDLDAELGPDRDRPPEQFGHLLRPGAGGHVVILRLPAHQQVPNAAAHQASLVAGFFERPHDSDGVPVQNSLHRSIILYRNPLGSDPFRGVRPLQVLVL